MEGIIMKRLLIILLGVTLIFFGCSKNDFVNPGLDQNDQNTLKKAFVKTAFTGKEFPVANLDPGEISVLPNGKTLQMGAKVRWFDVTTAPTACGLTDWTFNALWDGEPMASPGKYWGKGRMIVKTITPAYSPELPASMYTIGDDSLGIWDITFHGPIVAVKDSEGKPALEFTAYSTGIGESGEVKGFVSHMVYVFNTSVGYYTINGFYIVKHGGHGWHGHR